MLHLALVLPSDRSRPALEELRAHEGVASLRHLPGAAVDPRGDVIEADVARESADELIDRLRHHCTALGGTITVTEIAVAIGDRIERAERAAPGEGVDAVLWDQLAERTGEDARLSATFLVFLIAATLISAVGILTDSEVLVVGGMVLGPEFGPLAFIALSIVRRRPRQLLRGAVPLLVGFPVAIAATAGVVALIRATFGLPAGYLDGNRPLTSFISHPDQFSVIVALIAGVAGVVSLTSSRSGALVGVFISVTTIPAAANIGAALVTGRLDEAGGAAVQLGVNIGCLLVAAVVTLVVQRAARSRRRRREARGR
ncbi:DUF389 domain-containing protein [Amnibacterium kyonggiense]|uniref:Putative hydrophobic protein (TIGR00271 family) n=1 Tax=Amnibacterium kyonggiense TaxID=595671 RepID=A0A4R7FRL4_9MICO|nr:DUF389 domain-containing protein [Amnibacterium kyonggiense]TDS80472.1 putative hydrophobic protein (TIGR00271 family) [Amnibacterium kyonggiense]